LEEGGALEKEQLFSVDDEPWMAAYFGDYAINPDCSVPLKSRGIPYGIEAYKFARRAKSNGGTRSGDTSNMGTGASRRSALRRAREIEMHLNDPSVNMRLRGHTGTGVLECAACLTHFQARDGVAFPTAHNIGRLVPGAFCCGRCYLEAMPIKLMWRA
jgi:hypothetical protein